MGHRVESVGVSVEQHWKYFAEFCKYEIAAGGPDPHMCLAGYLSKRESAPERLWRAGCYAGVYNVPTAEVIWQNWPWPRILEEDMYPWLKANWKGFEFRRERKCVRMKTENLAEYFEDYAIWVHSLTEGERAWMLTGSMPDEERYEILWDTSQKNVKFLGRYSGLKLLEFYRRYCDVKAALPDLRPKGGWSPRGALALLRPDAEAALNGDDSVENLCVANEVANDVLTKANRDYKIGLDRYTLQVLLCDYKQSVIGKRQYPGRSQDSEIAYYNKIAPFWGARYKPKMFEARAEMFPNECLGEIQGWNRVREELGNVLVDYGYTWSDLLYDFTRTKDLSCPAKRRTL